MNLDHLNETAQKAAVLPATILRVTASAEPIYFRYRRTKILVGQENQLYARTALLLSLALTFPLTSPGADHQPSSEDLPAITSYLRQ